MSADRVEVWWLDVDGVGADQWAELTAVLDASEQARAARFHFDRDRQTYIAAHALGRRLLSAWAGGDPASWRFTIGDHGKPEVISPANGPCLRLNLSHTRGLAAAVLTEECDVGVDVEWLGRDPDCLGLGRRFFAAAECAVLEAAPPQRLAHTFLSFWTLKEAYIKAIGKGLAQPLDSFAFTLEPLSIAFTDTLADDPAHWRFHQAQPNDQHLLALALRHPHPDRVQVELRAMDF